jgi:hypothetical protein
MFPRVLLPLRVPALPVPLLSCGSGLLPGITSGLPGITSGLPGITSGLPGITNLGRAGPLGLPGRQVPRGGGKHRPCRFGLFRK